MTKIFLHQQRKQWSPWTGPHQENQENFNNNNNEDGNDEGEDDHDWPSAKRRRSEDPRDLGREGFPPAPIPAWFHPPLALPALAKEEIVDPWPGETKEDQEDPGEQGEGDKESGVTPPLMSPMSGVVSPFPPGVAGGPPGGGVVDPRQLLHLLARKVGQKVKQF